MDTEVSLEERRRFAALELAQEGFRSQGLSANTREIIKQALAFEAFLKDGGNPDVEAK